MFRRKRGEVFTFALAVCFLSVYLLQVSHSLILSSVNAAPSHPPRAGLGSVNGPISSAGRDLSLGLCPLVQDGPREVMVPVLDPPATPL